MAVMEMEEVLVARMVVGLADLVQLGKDGLLDLQLLDGGLHHQVGVGGGSQVGGKGHLVGDGLLAGLVHLALGNQLVQALVQASSEA